MLDVVASRNVIKIAVSSGGKKKLEEVADRYGMKEYIVGGKIYEWFAAQDDIYQRAVLGLLKGLEIDAADAYMRRMRETHKERKTPHETNPPVNQPAPKPEPAGKGGA